MQKYDGQLLRKFPSETDGIAAVGVSVDVRILETNVPAILYENALGTIIKENPLTTDTNGYYSFFADTGNYKINFSNGFPELQISLGGGGGTAATVDMGYAGLNLDNLQQIASKILIAGEQAKRVANGLRKRFNPLDYGAVGNGVANDTTPCQNAANDAALYGGGLYLPEGYTFAINGYLQIKNGTKIVYGGGGIKSVGPLYGGLMLKGITSGQSTNVKKCIITEIEIDCNGIPGSGIYAENISECHIIKNKIYNVIDGYGILVRAFNAGNEDCSRNIIANNTLRIDATDNPNVYGIELSSPYPYADPVANWKANFADVATPYINAFSIVANNIIYGGYYGVSLSWAKYCTVMGNQTTRNVRGVSVQHLCLSNNIAANHIFDNLSSGITVGYNSNDNSISANHVYSSRASVQGMLNCYVGCTGNNFKNNELTCSAGVGPNWYIYCAINSNENIFEYNTLKGPCQKAYMAIESAWNNAVPNPAHYAYGEPASVNNFANASSVSNALIGNKIIGTSAKPAIFLGQIQDAAARFLDATIVKSNIIFRNTHNYQLELYEQNASSLRVGNLSDNDFHRGSSASKFVLPRGKAHFSICKGNFWLNSTSFVDQSPPNDSYPSVALRDNISLAGYTVPNTRILDFVGGVDGQNIMVKLSVNVFIQQDPSKIRLKGGVDVTGVTSDNIIAFTRNANIWFETFRNF